MDHSHSVERIENKIYMQSVQLSELALANNLDVDSEHTVG